MCKSKGFTVIEVTIVLVVIVAILAFIAPNYLKLTNAARKSAVISMAGALGASNAANYALRHVDASKGMAISNCSNLSSLLAGGLPENYVIDSVPVTPGSSAICTLSDVPKIGEKVSASFYAFGIS